MKKLKMILMGILLMMSTMISATSIASVQDGSWKISNTWNLNAVPTCGNTIIINHIVTISGSIEWNCTGGSNIIINSGGGLINGETIKLPAGSSITINSGGYIDLKKLKIGGTKIYNGSGSGMVYGPVYIDKYGVLNTLPVSLLSFTAERTKDNIIINWSTASEENNGYFTIEKSYDMESWNTLATVGGAGNSNEVIHYEITDIDNEQVYYRLTQTDFDGKSETFNIISVGNVLIEKVLVDMYDVAGRKLKYIQNGLVLFLYDDGSVEKKFITK